MGTVNPEWANAEYEVKYVWSTAMSRCFSLHNFRIVTRFAWVPRRILGRWRWLRRVTLVETLEFDPGYMIPKPEWTPYMDITDLWEGEITK